MREFLYGQDSFLIAAALLTMLFAAMATGARIGLKRQPSADEHYRQHVSTLLGSILGLLALLLGFSFSMALQRYEGRSDAVVDEANAIGTTWLRAQLLPAAVQGQVRDALRDYVELRVDAGRISLDREESRQAVLVRSTALLDRLWILTGQAVAIDPGPATSGLFIQTLNDTIDSFGRRDALLNRHVPELVLFLLHGAVLMTGGLLGYSCGIAGHRPSAAAFVFGLLVVAVVFVITDIDRPRRGLIQVNQASLVNLAAEIAAAEAARNQTPGPAAARQAVTGRP
jgi:hypothetical protein